jgi:predicted dienelactone hydrolase
MLGQAADPSSPFAGRLRPDAVGISGLSFGGITTLLAAQREPRFRAALALVPGGTDVLAPEPITIPTMVIGAERDGVVAFAESERAYERVAGPRFLVELLAANHLSVVDDCAPFCVAEDIAQEEAHRLVLHYAVPFLRHYLGGRRGGLRALTRAVSGVEVRAEPRRDGQ